MTGKNSEVATVSLIPCRKEEGTSLKSYCGGKKGNEFDDGYSNKRITAIAIMSNGIVDSIAVRYDDGSFVTHGGQGGYEEQRFEFWNNEHIVKVTIWLCFYKDDYVVYGLKFFNKLRSRDGSMWQGEGMGW